MPGEEQQRESLWQEVLRDVAAQTAGAKALPPKSLLVLGDEQAGKTTLLQRLQGRKGAVDDALRGTGIEFSYLDIKDEETEDILSRLGVFVLDGNADFKPLLEYALPPPQLPHTVVLVVLDMSKPWGLQRSLERWLGLLSDYLATCNSAELDDQKASLVTQFVNFSESPLPQAGENGEANGSAAAGAEAAEAAAINGEAGAGSEPNGHGRAHDLEDGVLTRNLGLPIIVVCTKCDATASLEKDRDFRQEHFDFIQMHLRKTCLQYGAALVYSGKDGRTTALLRSYIANRAWKLPMHQRANIAERDAVFVPSGWDSLQKISQLYDSFKTFQPDDALEARILPPPAEKPQLHEQYDIEEEQEFLKRAQQLIGTPGRDSDPSRAP